MKRFFVFSAAAILLGTLGILKADETPTAGDFRSYTQGFAPQLGGVYRNPDAYLPYYPGYAPYWQSAPPYSYAYPGFYYPYGIYSRAAYMPGGQCCGQRSGEHSKGR